MLEKGFFRPDPHIMDTMGGYMINDVQKCI